jgi:hypothetical protein
MLKPQSSKTYSTDPIDGKQAWLNADTLSSKKSVSFYLDEPTEKETKTAKSKPQFSMRPVLFRIRRLCFNTSKGKSNRKANLASVFRILLFCLRKVDVLRRPKNPRPNEQTVSAMGKPGDRSAKPPKTLDALRSVSDFNAEPKVHDSRNEVLITDLSTFHINYQLSTTKFILHMHMQIKPILCD